MGIIMNTTEQKNNPNIEHIKKIYFWRTAFFSVVILVAGIVIGSASMSILTTRKLSAPPSPRQEFNDLVIRLRRNLELSQGQTNKIRPMIDKHMQKLQELRENARIDIINTLEQMDKQVSSVLNERQKQIWQRELLSLQRELNPEMPRGGGGRRRGLEPRGPRSGRGQRRFGQGLVNPAPPLTGPNSLRYDTNQNENSIKEPEPNQALQN
jgi:hypothetical protein